MYNKSVTESKRFQIRIPEALLQECRSNAEKLGMNVTQYILQSIWLGGPILMERLGRNTDNKQPADVK